MINEKKLHQLINSQRIEPGISHVGARNVSGHNDVDVEHQANNVHRPFDCNNIFRDKPGNKMFDKTSTNGTFRCSTDMSCLTSRDGRCVPFQL